jgi:hypothetical protein
MLAVGFALSYHVLTIYYQRLMCHSLPPREAIVSCFIPVGAVGMAGWALLNLATAAELHVKSYIVKLPESHPTSACECLGWSTWRGVGVLRVEHLERGWGA